MPSVRAASRIASRVVLVRDAVDAGVVALVELDVVRGQVPLDADQLRGAAGDPQRPARGSRPAWPTRRCRAPGAAGRPPRSRAANPATMPGLGAAGHRADDDGVEEDAELALLLGDLVRPARRSRARRAGGPRRRPGWRTACRRAPRPPRSACSQLSLKPMPNPALTSRTSAPASRLMQDVADLVVDGVRPVDPALLHQHALQAQRAAATAATWRVWLRLHAADRDQRVAALRQRVGDEVLELAGLVAAVTRCRSCSPPAWPTARAPPRCAVSRSSRCTGDGPNSSGCRAKSWMGTVVSCSSRGPRRASAGKPITNAAGAQ